MDGGSLMAGAVKLVHQMGQETDQGGADSDDDEDVRDAALMEYVNSWKHAGEHIMEAISNGAEVCFRNRPNNPQGACVVRIDPA